MKVSKRALAAIAAVAFVAGPASAGEWQALKGVSATPMKSTEMDAVKGKLLPANYMSLLLSGQPVDGLAGLSALVGLGGANFFYLAADGDDVTISFKGFSFTTQSSSR